VNHKDIVPHWPKSFTANGYLHIENEVWYWDESKNMNFKLCNDKNDEDENCSDSVIGNSIDDHLKYIGYSTKCNNNQPAFLETL
jgi:hypothetical protein